MLMSRIILLVPLVLLTALSASSRAVFAEDKKWSFHKPADYRVCHNFVYHQITGKNLRQLVSFDTLVKTLQQYGFRKEKDFAGLSSISGTDLRYGDVLLIGKAHSGIVDFFKVPGASNMFYHFRGFTVWNSAGKVMDRSNRPKPPTRPKPLDHGIYGQSVASLASNPTYAKLPVSIWRLKLAGAWEPVAASITIGGEKKSLPVQPGGVMNITVTALDKGMAKINMRTSDQPESMPALATLKVDFPGGDMASGETSEGQPARASLLPNGQLTARLQLDMNSASTFRMIRR